MSIEDLWKEGEDARVKEVMKREVTQICQSCGLKMEYSSTLGWVCTNCKVARGHNGHAVR